MASEDTEALAVDEDLPAEIDEVSPDPDAADVEADHESADHDSAEHESAATESTKASKLLSDYLLNIASLIMPADKDDLRVLLENEANAQIVNKFANTGEGLLVVQRTTETSEDSKEEEAKYAVAHELPEDCFDKKASLFHHFLMLVKTSPEPLSDLRPIAAQVLPTIVDSRAPLSSVMPFVRSAFVPVVARMVQSEEERLAKSTKKAVAGTTAVSKTASVLAKLRDLELKLADTEDSSAFVVTPLEPTALIARYLETLSDSERMNVSIHMDATHTLFLDLQHAREYGTPEPKIEEKEQERLDIMTRLCTDEGLNTIQARLKDWKSQIQLILRQNQPPSGTTVAAQVKFWENKKNAVAELKANLNSPEVVGSLHVLELNKSVMAVTQFKAIGVDEAEKDVKSNYSALADFPIDVLNAAKSVQKISDAITEIFRYLDSHRIRAYFKIDKTKSLARDSARDIALRLYEVLTANIMFVRYDTFVKRTANIDNRVFQAYERKFNRIRTEARSKHLQSRSRMRDRYASAWPVIDEKTELHKLATRLESIKSIRESQDQLETVTDPTFSSADKKLLEKSRKVIMESYERFRTIDVLTCDETLWKSNVEAYESSIIEVELNLRDAIQAKMAAASEDPKEMFRICEKFNSLFVREKIRGAVLDFQQQLIENVDREVNELFARFKLGYETTPASRLTELHDIPSVSGKVIWLKQLERQLKKHTDRVKAVLGEKWADFNAGQKLSKTIDRLQTRLDPRPIITEFAKYANTIPPFDAETFIFSVKESKLVGAPIGALESESVMTLRVNFDEKHVNLFKEVRRLSSLGIRVGRHGGPSRLATSAARATGTIHITLNIDSIEVKRRYPLSVKLREAVAVFTRTTTQLRRAQDVAASRLDTTMMPHLAMLVDAHKAKVQKRLSAGVKLKWSTGDRLMVPFCEGLAKDSILFHEATLNAMEISEMVDRALADLYTCEVHAGDLDALMETLRKAVTSLDDYSFSGIFEWTEELNQKIEKALMSRVGEVIDAWNKTLEYDWPIGPTASSQLAEYQKANPYFRATPIVHSVQMTATGRVSVVPPVADGRRALAQEMQEWLAKLVNQERPRAIDPTGRAILASKEPLTFKGILETMDTSPIVLSMSRVTRISARAIKYSQEWLSYQALWDMKIDDVFDKMGDDISKWIKLLNDMKKSQKQSFESSESEKSFGPILIKYGTIRSKVDSKYTEFRKETFKRLFVRLNDIMNEFHNDAIKGKYELEELSFSSVSVSDIVNAVTLLQRLKEKSADWDDLWTQCSSAEKLLQSNRYVLPPKWIRASRMRGVLDDFFAVLNKRWETLTEEAANIYEKLDSQFTEIVNAIKIFETDWQEHKPTQGWASTWTEDDVQDWLRESHEGSLRFALESARQNGCDGRMLHELRQEGERFMGPMLARKLGISDPEQSEQLVAALMQLHFTVEDIQIKLGEFDGRLKSIDDSFSQVKIAKDAMRLVIETAPASEEAEIAERLDEMKQELGGLKGVYDELGNRWRILGDLGKMKFLGMDCRELGKSIRGMEEELTKMPPKMRSYMVYHKFIAILKRYNKMNKSMFDELSSGVLKSRHWDKVSAILGLGRKKPESLKLEDLWSINLLKYEKEVTAVVTVARGENALENFLAELNERWQKTLFALVDFKGGKVTVPLVRNWTELREDIADALSDVMSMKQSPYFKAFEREASVWDEKLNAGQAIFDVMVDVQRRWVYLQGIFNASKDVQRQLGSNYHKFQAFDREFVALMKGIKAEPLVDNWVIPEKALLAMLEKNQNILNQIQKALNEFLEQQRQLFSRFYFIGDEDLLEIIGSSKNPIAINRHFPKMFAGLSQIVMKGDRERRRTSQMGGEDKKEVDPESPEEQDKRNVIVGMSSAQAEEVMFEEPVDIRKHEKIQGWLSAIEYQMRFTLASLLEDAISKRVSADAGEEYFDWVARYPAQVVLLATQISWCERVDGALKAIRETPSDETRDAMGTIAESIQSTLELLAARVLDDLEPKIRKLLEQLITEMVYQRDTTRELYRARISSESDFAWLYRMRFYWNRSEKRVMKKLEIRISRAKFYYGFEYFGATEKLVQTPLTDKAYLTLCEALHAKLGGNPFGPAGTGKTESVKALGAQLGRFVLVFCCDETFDTNAMSRIFIGLCQCGAWGCFDEFNRLEEQILSAVSQQILTIQTGLKEEVESITLTTTRGVERVKLDDGMGIFVTMNPGYAGRSELPDNLKQLFRGMAMIQPNRNLIAEVMLFSQGFGTAPLLASKIVLLFSLCKDQLSKQSHYDFGLRALKSVLRSAGSLKRSEQKLLVESMSEEELAAVDLVKMPAAMEETILIRSLLSTVVPKLVMADKFLFDSLLDSAFPGADIQGFKEEELKRAIIKVAKEKHYRCDEQWMIKLMQFNTIQNITHGVMLVGPAGTGKSAARNVLTEALAIVTKRQFIQHEIDPKAINKDQLYGVLDPTTQEWTDGVFTSILRSIIGNLKGEQAQEHWIVLDGDVDPEWAENLNSVLDDNKMLTLPNGERLSLTDNIRIIFETPNLNYATQATVSRCGMVWFSEECVSLQMLFYNQMQTLRNQPTLTSGTAQRQRPFPGWENVHKVACDFLQPIFDNPEGVVNAALVWAAKRDHVMTFTETRAVWSLFGQLRGALINIFEFNEENEGMELTDEQIRQYIGKFLFCGLLWAFGGPMKLDLRGEFGGFLVGMMGMHDVEDPPVDSETTLIDFEVNVEDQSWRLWKDQIYNDELVPSSLKDPNVVINTIDTLRHSRILGLWLKQQKPVILCGPPGSGKSMTLTAVLRANPICEMVTLNFSSTADTSLLFKCFDQYCKVSRSSTGYVLRPTMSGKILVIFCDECNLPAEDLYGTQGIITFIRQLIEKGGYWHPTDRNWIRLEDVQVVGACNPPTDAGRVVLTPRFLNHCPLVLVDFPGRESLLEIYGSFIGGLMKLCPSSRDMMYESITTAMVDVYQRSQRHFSPDMQAHYVYSPRELSRWTRAMYRALNELTEPDATTATELVRLWAHEALRLFSDRLVHVEERTWTWDAIVEVAQDNFGGVGDVDMEEALTQPILYTDYLNEDRDYASVDKEMMRDFILKRIEQFNEEELDVPLVVYNELIDHILRIDRVLRQPLGHLLMVGAAGAGKTVFSRFVSWMLGMKTFQLKVHKDYSADDFDMDLRAVLVRSGVHGEKITFIFDESNILDTAFLERMNALLASGEVPGLFEDADYQQLIRDLREAARVEGLIIDTDEELYQWFTKNVQLNLHIVFTMNPAGGDFSGRAATSPALFNRCVINWWGTWSKEALLQVAREFTSTLELELGVPEEIRTQMVEQADGSERCIVFSSVAQTIVDFHELVEKVMAYLAKNMATSTFVTPRHFLDLIRHFKKIFDEKRSELEEQQKHLSVGLKALKETEEEVAKRKVELNEKEKQIAESQSMADEKLKEIMKSEKEALASKEEAERVEKIVQVEMVKIEERSEVVEAELAEAKPALEAAMKSVSLIQKKQLDEIRALKKPPEKVRMTLEAVVLLLGPKKLGLGKKEKVTDWGSVQKALANPKFVKMITKFDTDSITEKTRIQINKEYLDRDDFDVEKITKSSVVCGPMAGWIISQVKFARLLQTVDPMRQEIKDLKESLKSKQIQATELRAQVDQLERDLVAYKQDYEKMVQKLTELKNEMKQVQATMGRAVKLLQDLSEEKTRWSDATASFEKQLSTLVGDCLLSAGFLTYIGYYNITYRKILVSKWKEILMTNNLPFNETMELSAYLCAPADRIAWTAAALPDDELCVENAIILERFNRFPLLVDPSGQATTFLMNHLAHKKIVRTSFLDDQFNKKLETGLRFGTPLLIEDVESMDPILNPVLNRETQKVGGRTLIKLANKELDFSPTFTMFLVTRDPTAAFTPDLCSRVTFVNFSVTPSSLLSQCLSQVLRIEAPEIDEKRSEQLRLQGEFKFQLRELEDNLLNALNSIEGNILDEKNEHIMTTLETLKAKAKIIEEKAAESQQVLEQIDEASRFYTPFARSCTKLYFSLESLAAVSFLYQFDLKSFLNIINVVLNSSTLPEIEEMKKQIEAEGRAPAREDRLVPLMKALHRLTYVRTKRSLLVQDHTSFGVRVAQAFVDCHPDDDMMIQAEYFQYLLKGIGYKEGPGLARDMQGKLELTTIGSSLLANLFELTGFNALKQDMERNLDDWVEYRMGGAAAKIPNDFSVIDSERKEHEKLLGRLIIQKALRADQMPRTARKFIEAVFDWDLDSFEASADSLGVIVDEQLDSDTPLLMASRPGSDPSSQIDALAIQKFGAAAAKRNYESFAMGSPEEFGKAQTAITKACKAGSWVLLKNVHLCPQWLAGLEKTLHRIAKKPEFRLFLTMEMVDKIPRSMLRKSTVIINEPPLGMKASLTRTFNSLTAERIERAPEQRGRLFVLLAWLHAIVLERLRFEPIGWSKAFEFSETDRFCAMEAMDEWIDRVSSGAATIDKNDIPYDAMHKMLVQYVYGGRIDNAFDTARLTSFVMNLFCAESYNADFALSSRCVLVEAGTDIEVGRLGWVYPTVGGGAKVDREMLARVVEVDGARLKVVFLQKYLVFGKDRINLNSRENWVAKGDMRVQDYTMETAVKMPASTQFVDIREWVSHIDDNVASNPAFIGLPPRAEMIILATRAAEMCGNVQKLQDIETDGAMEELTAMLSSESAATGGTVPAWMRELADTAGKWIEMLPEKLEALREKSDSIKNPLFRFMRREFMIAQKVLKTMRRHLNEFLLFVSGELKATNDLRLVVAGLGRDEIPKFWNQYAIAPLGVTYWIQDFVRRSEQVIEIAKLNYVETPYESPMWLGGMFSPAGFVAATRQFVAQKNTWSMETMILTIEINEGTVADNCFLFNGLTLFGAGFNEALKCLELTEKTATPLSLSRFRWVNSVDEDTGARTGAAPDVVPIFIPVYLNASFKQLLFNVRVPVLAALPPETWVQLSVSMSVWAQ